MPIISGGGGGGGSGSSADTVYDQAWFLSTRTAHSGDDDFNTNTLANYTAVTTAGTATWLQGADVMSVIANAQTADHAAALLKPITIAQGGFIESSVRLVAQSTANAQLAGLAFTDGTAAGSNCVLCSLWQSSTVTSRVALFGGTLSAFEGTFGVTADLLNAYQSSIFMRLDWVNATTWRGRFSPDGVTWTTYNLATGTKAFTPTQMGLFVCTFGTSQDMVASFEYLRCSG